MEDTTMIVTPFATYRKLFEESEKEDSSNIFNVNPGDLELVVCHLFNNINQINVKKPPLSFNVKTENKIIPIKIDRSFTEGYTTLLSEIKKISNTNKGSPDVTKVYNSNGTTESWARYVKEAGGQIVNTTPRTDIYFKGWGIKASQKEVHGCQLMSAKKGEAAATLLSVANTQKGTKKDLLIKLRDTVVKKFLDYPRIINGTKIQVDDIKNLKIEDIKKQKEAEKSGKKYKLKSDDELMQEYIKNTKSKIPKDMFYTILNSTDITHKIQETFRSILGDEKTKDALIEEALTGKHKFGGVDDDSVATHVLEIDQMAGKMAMHKIEKSYYKKLDKYLIPAISFKTNATVATTLKLKVGDMSKTLEDVVIDSTKTKKGVKESVSSSEIDFLISGIVKDQIELSKVGLHYIPESVITHCLSYNSKQLLTEKSEVIQKALDTVGEFASDIKDFIVHIIKGLIDKIVDLAKKFGAMIKESFDSLIDNDQTDIMFGSEEEGITVDIFEAGINPENVSLV